MDYTKLVKDHGDPASLTFDGTTLTYHWPEKNLRLEVTKVSEGLFHVLWNGNRVSEGRFPRPWIPYETSARLFPDEPSQDRMFDHMPAFVGDDDYLACWEAFQICDIQHVDELMPGPW